MTHSHWSYYFVTSHGMFEMPTCFGLEVAIVWPRLASPVITVTGTVLSKLIPGRLVAGSGPACLSHSPSLPYITWQDLSFATILDGHVSKKKKTTFGW